MGFIKALFLLYYVTLEPDGGFMSVGTAPISILMSTYHRDDPQQLWDSLRSVRDQTLVPAEIVIVVGGAINHEIEHTLSRFAETVPPTELVIVRQEQNLGLGAALQLGLKHCRYLLVARMDSDDLAHPDRLEKQYAFMATHPDTDILSSWHEEFDQDPAQINAIKKTPPAHEQIARILWWRNVISHPTLMFRTDPIRSIGGYRQLWHSEDLDLYLRAATAGLHFASIQEPLVSMRTNLAQKARRTGFRQTMLNLQWRWNLFREGHLRLWQFAIVAPAYYVFHIVPSGTKQWLYKFVRSTPKADQG